MKKHIYQLFYKYGINPYLQPLNQSINHQSTIFESNDKLKLPDQIDCKKVNCVGVVIIHYRKFGRGAQPGKAHPARVCRNDYWAPEGRIIFSITWSRLKLAAFDVVFCFGRKKTVKYPSFFAIWQSSGYLVIKFENHEDRTGDPALWCRGGLRR